MRKQLTLEKQIEEIMNHYWFDPYNKKKYIKDCSEAIVKVVLGMVGEDETPESYEPKMFKELKALDKPKKKIKKLEIHKFESDGTVGNCAVCGRGPYAVNTHDWEGDRTKINEIIERINNAMQGSKAALEIMLENELKQEIRQRILGEEK